MRITPCARFGYVSPSGTYYPCAYLAHTACAQSILDTIMGSEYRMRKTGYVTITANGFDYDSTPTPEQRTVCEKILEAFNLADPSTDWDITLRENPEEYEIDYSDYNPPSRFATDDGQTIPEFMAHSFKLTFNPGQILQEMHDHKETLSKRPEAHPETNRPSTGRFGGGHGVDVERPEFLEFLVSKPA